MRRTRRVSFTQTDPKPWPSGHGAAAAVLAFSPSVLAAQYGLQFFEGSDNLDQYDAAVIRLDSGRRLGLFRHRGNPSPGTEIHTDDHDNYLDALREFLEAFNLSTDSLVWTRPEVSLDRLLSDDGDRAERTRGSSEVIDPRTLFLENLQWIEKVAGVVCRKHGIWGDDAADFAAAAKLKLMENDYADLRKFQGNTAATTYLAALVVRRFHEYARERWGRWRHSAAAEREGQLAKDLEMLVHRDGYSLTQAGEQLRNAGKTDFSDTALARLLAKLPARQPLRATGVSVPLDTAPSADRADQAVSRAEQDRKRGTLYAALFKVMEQFSPEERHILRMHFADGRTVADVARALRLAQKPLYRRIETLRRKIRAALEHDGVTFEDVQELLNAPIDE